MLKYTIRCLFERIWVGYFIFSLRPYIPIIGLLISSCSQLPEYRPIAIEGKYTLSIVVKNISPGQGVLRIGVYNDKKGWMSPSGMVRGRVVLVQSEEEHIDIVGLPAGNYAVALHQDLNGNNIMDKSFFILPKEPYGFSNNVGKYGPASYSKASFSLEKSEIIVVYMNQLKKSKR